MCKYWGAGSSGFRLQARSQAGLQGFEARLRIESLNPQPKLVRGFRGQGLWLRFRVVAEGFRVPMGVACLETVPRRQ